MKDDALRKNFMRRLNYYLTSNQLTQADLARHMGVSTATTAKWATGVTMPRMDKIVSIAHFLGVEHEDLIGEDERKPVDDLLMTRLVNAARGCTPEQINRVISLLESFKDPAQ